ncbi:MAG: hypothetical protein IFK94_09740 [Acidobacteria bacterium]|uniref:Transporter n=1 Tax=Candidatus Polarisedimenticola svalbardensis TaxID=2886004 RepID=A0A8J6Y599_9BACT|nr:hypothetical protein [Candidatus Polarisedimenticola svalbardensis]
MNQQQIGCLIIAILFLSVGAAGAGDRPGEWTLLTTYSSGDFGTDTVVDSSSMIVRYAIGNRWRLQVDLPMIRSEFAYGVVNTGAGPAPIGPEEEMRRRGSGPGSGQGSGGSLPVMAAVYESDTGWNQGVGDVRIGLSRRLAGGGVRLFRFDAELNTKLPTAEEADGLGTGETDVRLGLAGDYKFWSATMFAGAGFNRLGDPWWGELNDVVDLYAGIESDPIAGGRLILSGWVSALQEVVDGAGDLASVGAGLRTTGKYRWYAQVATGVRDASPDTAVLVGLAFGTDGGERFRRGGLK